MPSPIGSLATGPLSLLARRVVGADRALALVDHTRFITRHEAWLSRHAISMDMAEAVPGVKHRPAAASAAPPRKDFRTRFAVDFMVFIVSPEYRWGGKFR